MALRDDVVDRVISGEVDRRNARRPGRLRLALAMAWVAVQAGPALAVEGGAPGDDRPAAVSPSPKSLWVNPGLYSVHFEDKHFNDENWGLGVEYRYTDSLSVTAGAFRNSDWKTSHYLSWYWEPFTLGPVKLGATIGAMDGYPGYHDGGWFLAAIPAAAYEGKRFGLNVLAVPGYKDRLHSAISFQLKFRVW